MRLLRAVGAATSTLPVVALACLVGLGTPAAAADLPDFGTSPVEDTSSAQGSPILDVRVGANEGFDRFVVEFEGGIGPYFVLYVDQVTQDGSGDVVEVGGSAFIQVSLNGIPNEPPAPQQPINADLPGLIEVVGAGAGFEATVSYGLGTAEAAGFRVFTLEEPTRLVVDIAHPDTVPTATNTADPTQSGEPSQSAAPPTSTDVSEAATDSGNEESPRQNWLLWSAIVLIALAVGALIVSWRMRSPPQR